jgi:hypothetical protein
MDFNKTSLSPSFKHANYEKVSKCDRRFVCFYAFSCISDVVHISIEIVSIEETVKYKNIEIQSNIDILLNLFYK